MALEIGHEEIPFYPFLILNSLSKCLTKQKQPANEPNKHAIISHFSKLKQTSILGWTFYHKVATA